MRKIEVFYPSYTKKALTFTIDDGNMKYDAMLLDILKPCGIKGTFNLCSNLHRGKEQLSKEFYEGYGIANHSKYHPLVNFDGIEYVLSDEPFNEDTADKTKIYRVQGNEGFFWVIRPNGWRQMVFEDDFITYIKEGKEELEGIFTDREIKDYVWPYCEQNNAHVKEFIRKTHRSARKTGCTLDSTRFAIPADKYAWSYNATDTNLLEIMKKYEEYPPDAELKFFAFGVHSIDFERDGKWDDLRVFAQMYGGRPDTYWYATVGEIFDYDEAVKMLDISDGRVLNRSELTVYVKIDDEQVALEPGAEFKF